MHVDERHVERTSQRRVFVHFQQKKSPRRAFFVEAATINVAEGCLSADVHFREIEIDAFQLDRGVGTVEFAPMNEILLDDSRLYRDLRVLDEAAFLFAEMRKCGARSHSIDNQLIALMVDDNVLG